MRFFKAKVADILRSSQRDEAFINELNNQVDSIIKICGLRIYNKYYKYVNIVSNLWYYILTSGSNLQTLGEEYAGILRVVGNNKLPSSLLQALWIVSYIGGDKIFDRLIKKMRNTFQQSTTLTDEAKIQFVYTLDFLKENKYILLRLHQAFFYIHGKYYNVSNRLTGIKYVLLRDWLQDSSSSSSFKILGQLSLLYLIIYLLKYDNSKVNFEQDSISVSLSNNKICVLCNENRKHTASTPCGHLYCWNCIYESVKYSPHCPSCREIIQPSRIVYLQNYT